MCTTQGRPILSLSISRSRYVCNVVTSSTGGYAHARTVLSFSRPCPAPLKVVGEEITVLASGAQTSSYEIFRQAGPEGSGPPPIAIPGTRASTCSKATSPWHRQARSHRQGGHAGPPSRWNHPLVPVRARRRSDGLDDVPGGRLAMFADFDREISPESPNLAKLIELGQRYGLAVAVPAS